MPAPAVVNLGVHLVGCELRVLRRYFADVPGFGVFRSAGGQRDAALDAPVETATRIVGVHHVRLPLASTDDPTLGECSVAGPRLIVARP